MYVKGFDRARYFMGLEPYKNMFRNLLGREPYEGTLNIKLNNKSYRDLLKECGSSLVIENFSYNGREYGGLYIWFGEVKEIGKVLVIRPFRSGHEENVLEIVSDQKISDVLNLKHGDLIEVHIECNPPKNK